mmetsp:Transcript_62592/g.125381  ORF Transcript_62592/g.125381 Transcript_62592/m.125381 type:complete len:248 (+) Transcript_62592:158-901(+)
MRCSTTSRTTLPPARGFRNSKRKSSKNGTPRGTSHFTRGGRIWWSPSISRGEEWWKRWQKEGSTTPATSIKLEPPTLMPRRGKLRESRALNSSKSNSQATAQAQVQAETGPLQAPPPPPPRHCQRSRCRRRQRKVFRRQQLLARAAAAAVVVVVVVRVCRRPSCWGISRTTPSLGARLMCSTPSRLCLGTARKKRRKQRQLLSLPRGGPGGGFQPTMRLAWKGGRFSNLPCRRRTWASLREFFFAGL